MSTQTKPDVGASAPDFTLKDGDGVEWRLNDQHGKIVVLLFYPGDGTPVCTRQFCSLRDNWQEYEATGAEVVGISMDSVASHKKFTADRQLPLKLLSDKAGEVTKLYDMGSWLPGRSARAVVIVDRAGIIRYRKVQPLSVFKPSDDEVLGAIKSVDRT